MGRDVEVDVEANDKTSAGLRAVERSFKRSQDKIKKTQDDANKNYGRSLIAAVDSVSPKLAEGLVRTMASVGEAAGPLLAGGIAAAAPLIGATISAAISAGVAVGVVGLGVALVAQDARVQAAGKQLGAHFMESLRQDASPFIGPVLAGIAKIQASFDGMQGRLQRIFRNGAKFVAPLVDGVTRGLDGIIRGIDQLTAKSQPVVDALGESLGKLGQSFGDFLGGTDTTGAAAAIRDLTDALTTLLGITGPLLNGLSQIYGWLSKFGVVKQFALQLLGPIGQVYDLLKPAKTSFSSATAGVDDLGLSFQAASADAMDYAAGLAQAEAAVQGVYSANRDLYSSVTNVAGAFDTATAAAKKNGKTLDENTPKGRANRDALSAVATALQQNYDGYVKVNGAGAGASQLAEELRGKFVKLAEKMGASSGRAQQLASDLLGIPNVKRDVTVRTDAAAAAAEALKRKLATIKDRTVYVNVAFNQGRLNKVEAQLSRINHAGLAGDTGWEGSAGGAGSRTGGAQQINVTSRVDVMLDGKPFRTMVDTAVRDSQDRTAWRTKVGTR